jgi:hypothetical protein
MQGTGGNLQQRSAASQQIDLLLLISRALSLLVTHIERNQSHPPILVFSGRGQATATQPRFPRKIADFKQTNGFQISRHTLRKLTFD